MNWYEYCCCATLHYIRVSLTLTDTYTSKFELYDFKNFDEISYKKRRILTKQLLTVFFLASCFVFVDELVLDFTCFPSLSQV